MLNKIWNRISKPVTKRRLEESMTEWLLMAGLSFGLFALLSTLPHSGLAQFSMKVVIVFSTICVAGALKETFQLCLRENS